MYIYIYIYDYYFIALLYYIVYISRARPFALHAPQKNTSACVPLTDSAGACIQKIPCPCQGEALVWHNLSDAGFLQKMENNVAKYDGPWHDKTQIKQARPVLDKSR